jgi:N-acetylglucosaminyldiphosphoundecaprenol N-acetyl-beta-D-mannosaminyltransferase
VSTTSYSDATEKIISWARAGESRYVAVATAHTLIEAHDSSAFREVINQADLVTPDGMPLVWMLRLKGERGQRRVYGPTLMLHTLRAAETESIPVGLYGSNGEVLGLLRDRLKRQFPQLSLIYAFSPPYRDLSPAENAEIARQIRESGTRILFVGLGCPKQERWMALQRTKIPVVMIGVGAAFDFLSGSKRQAPAWLQRAGLEWAFRLVHEPRRLWKRYLFHNPRFAVLAIADLIGFRHA